MLNNNQNQLRMSRVDVVDALRGFTVVAIMLLHFVEHFIYSVYPANTSETMSLINQSVNDTMFFMFSGKSYSIFALLFGFTFIVQQRNQEIKNSDFGGRFAWRLVLLMLFATLNAAFFPGGDVLMLFAVMGFAMIPFRRSSLKTLLVAAFIFLLQPIELLGCFGVELFPSGMSDSYYPELQAIVTTGNFWQMVWSNITAGQLASFLWAIDSGRLLQSLGLFLLGMILARGDYFSRGVGFWVKVFVIGFISTLIFYIAKTSVSGSLQIIFTMWYNVAFTALLVSVFVAFYQSDQFKNMTNGLRFYGRMSLTNYVSQSIIGSIIFFPYALGLATLLGTAWSFGVGLLVMFAQIGFCKWWLKNHKQGPLEYIWHRFTWM